MRVTALDASADQCTALEKGKAMRATSRGNVASQRRAKPHWLLAMIYLPSAEYLTEFDIPDTEKLVGSRSDDVFSVWRPGNLVIR